MYIHYLNFPRIPDQIINQLSREFNQYQPKSRYGNGTYTWSDSFNIDVNNWCQQYIAESMYFGFQIINQNLPIHKDIGTLIKLNYVIDTGGTNVVTKFWDNDKTTLLASYKIEPNRWHIFKADTFHSVENIQLNHTRFGVTGRVFGS